MVTIDSSRESASGGELACSVPIDPSWPVFIACSRSNASGPRTSPTMIRSGRMRRQFLTRSRMVISPSPSRFGGRVSNETTWGCCSCNSAVSSQVMIRSALSMKPVRQFSSVVLPDPVPPEIRILQPACASAANTVAAGCGRLSQRTRSSRVIFSRRKRRIVSDAPFRLSGGAITFTRDPSARRASQIGLDSSTRRPTRATMRWHTFIRWRSSRKRISVFSIRPPVSMKMSAGPLTMMSEMSSRASRRSSGP